MKNNPVSLQAIYNVFRKCAEKELRYPNYNGWVFVGWVYCNNDHLPIDTKNMLYSVSYNSNVFENFPTKLITNNQ